MNFGRVIFWPLYITYPKLVHKISWVCYGLAHQFNIVRILIRYRLHRRFTALTEYNLSGLLKLNIHLTGQTRGLMAVIKSSRIHVLKRFPEHKDVIHQHFRKNENFQTICDDYRQCAEALDHWNDYTSEEAPARRDEYADLLQDLESEILKTLNESA